MVPIVRERLHRSLFPLAVLGVLLASLLGPTAAAATTPGGPVEAVTWLTAPGTRASVVLLIDGLCSSLGAGGLPAPFTGAGRLVERLRAAGWTDDEILAFSYRGGTVESGGRWRANPYSCEDTRDTPLTVDAQTLDTQVRAVLVASPETDVHLVGFSQGGLIAVAYLAHLRASNGWTLPNGGRLASVVALGSPLGGLPFVEAACGEIADVCNPDGTPSRALLDMSAIWNTGGPSPSGATRSIASLFEASISAPLSNQALAAEAAHDHGVAVLALGNVRDWTYAPVTLLRPLVSFLDVQWLRSEGAGSRLYARVIDSGPIQCPDTGQASDAGCNHGRVLTDASALTGIVDLLLGRTPAAASTCAAGRGGCLMLQPRPPVTIASSIAPRIVTTGAAGFGTKLVKVAARTRVTVRFTTSPALAGVRLEIWTRAKTGAYRFLTSRITDAAGSARYHTPPVTAWTAYQARFAGSLANGAAVSPGRVAEPR